jgi:hypothetical protein
VIGALAGCTAPPSAAITIDVLASPAMTGSAQPNLAKGLGGELVLSWLEPDSHGVALRFSKLGANGWGPARSAARGGDWFVNWADFPSVVPIADSTWAAHWLVRRGPRAAYDVAIALSFDAGDSWSEAFTPHNDGTLSEHGFVSLFPVETSTGATLPGVTDGGATAIGAIWLDGRNMSGAANAMTLRGAIITPAQSLTGEHLLDNKVCDCCQTDVGVGPDGPIAVYRGRTDAEIRDIYVARLIDGRWQDANPVANDGWNISGCPVNGPAVDVRGSHVAVAWFTGANDKPRVRLARSSDGARNFSAPVDVSIIRPIGRVDVVTNDEGAAIVSWLRRSTPTEAELCVREVAADGSAGPVHVVAQMTPSRPSGFPQMQRDGERLILAWTDTSGEQSAVRSVRVNMAPP